jgi:hypothetical protein
MGRTGATVVVLGAVIDDAAGGFDAWRDRRTLVARIAGQQKIIKQMAARIEELGGGRRG